MRGEGAPAVLAEVVVAVAEAVEAADLVEVSVAEAGGAAVEAEAATSIRKRCNDGATRCARS